MFDIRFWLPNYWNMDNVTLKYALASSTKMAGIFTEGDSRISLRFVDAC